MAVVIVFQLLDSHLVQVVAKNGVVEIQKFAEMGVNDEGPVVDPEFRGPSDFYFNHPELVSGSSSACFDIKIYVFNVQHYELGEPVT